jgi:predicted DNA-binding transcriptional regulator YafY
LLSLAAARDFLAPLAGTFYWRGISQLIDRVERVATPALLDHAAKHREGLVVHPRPPAAKYTTRTLNAVNRAIRNSLELTIRYQGIADEQPRRIVIHPEALVVYDGSVYVAAYKAASQAPSRRRNGDDDADHAIRFSKLDRFITAKATSRPFTPRPESVESLLADSMTMFRSPRPPRRFRIRVSAARSRWARVKPFHPRQRVVPKADGGVILEIDRAWEDEIVPQLLALADAAEVLEPADVRLRMADTARKIAAQYQQVPPTSPPRPRRS